MVSFVVDIVCILSSFAQVAVTLLLQRRVVESIPCMSSSFRIVNVSVRLACNLASCTLSSILKW